MASVNKAIIVGNVGQEPKINSTTSGQKVVNITVATSERAYKTKDGRDIPERTEWHNVVLWRSLADVVEKFVHKGTSVYIEGKIRTRSYEKEGQKHYATEIEAESLQLLGSKAENATQETSAPSSAVETLKHQMNLEEVGNTDSNLPF